MTGISSQSQVAGVGQIKFTVKDDRGRTHDIITRAYYVPDAKVRLLSPQQYFREQGSGKMTVHSGGASFQFPGTQHIMTFPLHRGGSDLRMAYL